MAPTEIAQGFDPKPEWFWFPDAATVIDGVWYCIEYFLSFIVNAERAAGKSMDPTMAKGSV